MPNDPPIPTGPAPSDPSVSFTVVLHSGTTQLREHTIVIPLPNARAPLDQQLARAGGELSAVLWAALLDALHAQGLRPPGIVDEPGATRAQWQQINHLTERMEPEALDFYGAQAGVAFSRGRLTVSGAERLVAVLRDGPHYDPFGMLSETERAALDALEAERAAARPHEPLPGGWEVFALGGHGHRSPWADLDAQGSAHAAQEGGADAEPRSC